MHGLDERIVRLLGARATSWQRPADAVAGGNDRFTVQLDDVQRAFIKSGQGATHRAVGCAGRRRSRRSAGGKFPVVGTVSSLCIPNGSVEDLND